MTVPSSSTKTRSETEVRSITEQLVRELAPGGEESTEENPRLIDDLGYHSLALLEVAFLIEDEFNLEPIDQEAAATIVTLRDVQDYVVAKLGEDGRIASAG